MKAKEIDARRVAPLRTPTDLGENVSRDVRA